MKFDAFWRRSLKTKVVLMTLLVFVISIWLIASYISAKMREDIQGILGDQQLATVSLAAAELDSGFEERMGALQVLAKSLDAGLFDRPASLQQLLEQRPVLPILFNAGIFVTRSDGTAIAEVPKIDRVGLNYMDRDHIAAALTQGKATVGKPVVGRTVRAPSFAMTVPIRDAQGKVIGALSGATDLSRPNFLYHVNTGRYGRGGGYFTVDAAHRLVVTATDPSRFMTQLRPPGDNPVMDKRIGGFDEPAVNVNALGVELLSSSGRIPTAGWFLVATLPTQEAFAPIHAMQKHVLEVTALITALACVVVWLLMSGLLKRQFAPMISATQALDEITRTHASLKVLPVTRHDEVGALIGAFNRLLLNLGQREASLKKSEHLLLESQKAARIGSYINTLDAGTFESTAALDEIFGITKDYPHTNAGWVKFMHPDFMQVMHDALLDSINNRKPFDAEYKIIRPSDGAERWLHDLGQIAYDEGAKATSLIGTVQDITDRKLAAATLRESETRCRTVFQASPDAVNINRLADGLYIDINDGFTRLTGWTREDVLGKRSLDVGIWHDPADRQKLVQALQRDGFCEGLEADFVTRSGKVKTAQMSARIMTLDGAPCILSVTRDITERKLAEKTHRDSEERYRTLIEWTPEPLAVHDGKEFIFANAAAVQMLGAASEQDLLGKPLMNHVHPDSRDIVRERLRAGVEQGARLPLIEEKVLRLDGTPIDVEIQSRPIDFDGKQARLIAMRDITARKLAEESQRIAAVAFESQQAIFITDPQQLILQINKGFTRITGYTAEEAVGQTPRLLSSGQHGADFYEAMWACIARTGQWQGEIWNRRKNGALYLQQLNISTVKNAQGLLTHYVGTFSDMTSVKAAEAQIESLTFSDLLTGLPNRRRLIIQLQQAMMAGEHQNRLGALLLLDLDHFKNLNDTLGHEQGDLLLQLFAARLTGCVRDGETVARLGGDEFVVLLKELDQDAKGATARAETAARRLLDALRQPYAMDGTDVTCSASIGIALFGGRDEDTDEPLKRAELAMYDAKAQGRSTLRFFDPSMQALVNARVSMQAALLEAIEKNQFVLHYQAQVTQAGQITGAEALLRWPNPKRGMVSPAEFIPLAEETGLILPIGNWVLETACKQLVQWESQPRLAQLTIAVNISARQFHQSDFVDQVLGTLKRTGANAQRLKLELTESLLITDVQGVIGKMNALKGRGLSFSLDDFGTGYSSLSYLKRLPIDQLKIDQSFIRDILVDPDDAAIARTMVALADNLGLSVIAEGVETVAQRELLADIGCHQYQGYLFSRPLPVEDFEALVAHS